MVHLVPQVFIFEVIFNLYSYYSNNKDNHCCLFSLIPQIGPDQPLRRDLIRVI